MTASRRANELAHLISSHGGTPFLAPTVGIESNATIEKEAEKFCEVLDNRKVDFAIFMTGPGVFALLTGARGLGKEKGLVQALTRTTVVARSGKPKDALTKHGIRVDLVPKDATSSGLLELLRQMDVKSSLVTVLSHGSGSSDLCEGMRSMGAEVLEFSSYSYALETDSSGARILDSMKFNPVLPHTARVLELVDAIIGGGVDVVTFTSPPSVKNLFSVASEAGRVEALRPALNSIVVVAIGLPTRGALETAGVSVEVMPSVYKMGPMVKELCDYVRIRGPNVDRDGRLARAHKG